MRCFRINQKEVGIHETGLTSNGSFANIITKETFSH